MRWPARRNRSPRARRGSSPRRSRRRRRDEAIVRAPDDQRRRGDAPQAALETVLRNREEELRGRAEAAREPDQHLDLLLGAVVLVADRAASAPACAAPPRRTGRGRGSGTSSCVIVPEQVDDRRVVAPEADRCREREPADLRRPQRRHLRRDPSAHRLADDVGPLEAERLHDVEAVQEEVELIVEVARARSTARSRAAAARRRGRRATAAAARPPTPARRRRRAGRAAAGPRRPRAPRSSAGSAPSSSMRERGVVALMPHLSPRALGARRGASRVDAPGLRALLRRQRLRPPAIFALGRRAAAAAAAPACAQR